MNCPQARPLFIELLYGELEPARRQQLRAHLETCESCRSEWDSLEATHGLLNSVGVTTGNDDANGRPVDVGAIHQTVAIRAQASRRRWRRAALVVGTIAAVLLIAVAGGLQLQIHPTHIVVGFGEPEVRRVPHTAMTPPPDLHSLVVEQGEQLARLDELVHLATRELLTSDGQRSAQIEDLRDAVEMRHRRTQEQLNALKVQSDQRWRLTLNEFSRIAADTELADAGETPLQVD